jgi:hypothetical protein
MKADRSKTREGAEDATMSETVVHDPEWGDSSEGPVRGGHDVLPPSATGVTERMLERDARRDPWGGAPVQDLGEIRSGYYPGRALAEDYAPSPDDEQSGGDAGIVGKDDRLIDRGK